MPPYLGPSANYLQISQRTQLNLAQDVKLNLINRNSKKKVPRGVIYDGFGGKTGNIVGYGIVCVGIPIGDPAFVKRALELKEEELFDKIDRTVEL